MNHAFARLDLISCRRPNCSCSGANAKIVAMEEAEGTEEDKFEVITQEEEEDEPVIHGRTEPSMVCMCVVEDGPRIAFCAYSEVSNTIYVEESYSSGYETQALAERVLATVRPTLLLVSQKVVSNDALLEVLTTPPAPIPAECGEEGKSEPPANVMEEYGNEGIAVKQQDPRVSAIRYHQLKSSTFELKNCQAAIMRLCVRSLTSQIRSSNNADPNMPNRRFQQQGRQLQSYKISNYHGLASIVDFESTCQVQALGALLSFLETTIFRMQEGGIMVVSDVVHINATQHMVVSSEALDALNIFTTEHHPLSAVKGPGKAKEGVSLFSLLDRVSSRTGRQRLREWMLKPLINLNDIHQRQDGVELFMLHEMSQPASTLMSLLKNIGAVDTIIVRMQKCCAKANDFLVLIKTLNAAIAIVSTLQNEVLLFLQQKLEDNGQSLPAENDESDIASHYINFVSSIVQHCRMGHLYDLLDKLVAVVDEPATTTTGTVVVRYGYHPPLDQWKQQYMRLGDTLQPFGQALTEQLPHLQPYLVPLFMPQVGFLICLKHSPMWESRPDALPEDFVFIFSEDGASYFKNTDMRQLDESIGDIDSYIKDAEALIVSRLEEVILENEYELRDTFNALADLDCILAFSICAIEQHYVRPALVSAEEKCIRVQNGRHPLQEMIIETKFIANDIHIDNSDRVNIVTGPNFSGKSCYARQVGILTYMAHLGCFLPCDAAQISITDQIFAHFSVLETCAVPQSSFQLDLTQMGQILRRAQESSLIIVDEFGKGEFSLD